MNWSAACSALPSSSAVSPRACDSADMASSWPVSAAIWASAAAQVRVPGPSPDSAKKVVAQRSGATA